MLNRLSFMLAIGLATSAARAAVINVPADQPTIQAGIDAAFAGDEVVVADGTYTGSGNFNLTFLGKAITVRSAGGDPNLCVIDMQAILGRRGFNFENGETTLSRLEGFTIRNGNLGDYNHGGGIRCVASSPTIVNCILDGNSVSMVDPTDYPRGGGMYIVGGSPTLINCVFSGNMVHHITDFFAEGGGLYGAGENVTLINCVFSGNVASGVTCCGQGGAILFGGGLTMINCTLVGNSTGPGGAGGGLRGNETLINCVLWDNSPDQISPISSPAVSYSCVEGGWPGVNNIDADPLFVDPDGADGIVGTPDDDLRLLAGSPALDAADNIKVPFDLFDLDGDGVTLSERTPVDRNGDPRFRNSPGMPDTGNTDFENWLVDMGAFEFQPAPFLGVTHGLLDGTAADPHRRGGDSRPRAVEGLHGDLEALAFLPK